MSPGRLDKIKKATEQYQKLNVAALQDCGKREDFQARVRDALEEKCNMSIQTEDDVEPTGEVLLVLSRRLHRIRLV